MVIASGQAKGNLLDEDAPDGAGIIFIKKRSGAGVLVMFRNHVEMAIISIRSLQQQEDRCHSGVVSMESSASWLRGGVKEFSRASSWRTIYGSSDGITPSRLCVGMINH